LPPDQVSSLSLPERPSSADLLLSVPIVPAGPDPELEKFYLEYFLPLVRRAMRRHGLSSQDAHDVVQDTFILAIAKLDSAKNPKAWLYQVLDHLSANFQRKANRRARLMAQWSPGPPRTRRIASEGSFEDV
jgi:DNA-directed RNA polymerase specialized sigma24 family protein